MTLINAMSGALDPVEELRRRVEVAEQDRDRALVLAGLRLGTIVELRAELRAKDAELARRSGAR